jgi:Inner membrane protein YgaP-like, transmembrane domain
LLAVIFVSLIFAGQVHGVLAVILGVLAVIFVVTSVVSFCPLYVPFGLSTRKKK